MISRIQTHPLRLNVRLKQDGAAACARLYYAVKADVGSSFTVKQHAECVVALSQRHLYLDLLAPETSSLLSLVLFLSNSTTFDLALHVRDRMIVFVTETRL
jgi:hypothetical protein